MSLLSWMGRVVGLRDGQFWGKWWGGETWAGKPVTDTNAQLLSTWHRCTRLYGDVVGAMPLKFYERIENDDRKRVRDHPVALLIGLDPNADQTAQDFWSGMAASLATIGNAYAEKRFVGKTLVALEPMPCDVYPSREHSSDGSLEYRYTDRGKEYWLPQDKVLHIRGFNPFGKSDVGLSPLAAARQTLGIALATEEATGKTFAQGMRASGFFTAPPGVKLLKDQRDQFTETFINPIIGNDASAHYGILSEGFDFKTINIAPKDAEMLLSRRFNVEEICRFMAVPPILAGHSADGQTMWGSGVEAIINTWLTNGLDAFLKRIEQSIGKWLLSRSDRLTYYAEFDRDSLLRADSAARATFMSTMIQNGLMTPNEGRKLHNDLPLEGGDVLLVNSTLIPLKDAGAKNSGGGGAPAVPPPPAGQAS